MTSNLLQHLTDDQLAEQRSYIQIMIAGRDVNRDREASGHLMPAPVHFDTGNTADLALARIEAEIASRG